MLWQTVLERTLSQMDDTIKVLDLKPVTLNSLKNHGVVEFSVHVKMIAVISKYFKGYVFNNTTGLQREDPLSPRM